MQQQAKTVKLNHLPMHVAEELDRKWGALVAENGGFAEWRLMIDHARLLYIEEKKKTFLEPIEDRKRMNERTTK